MHNDQEHIDELIGKYLAGEANKEESSFVEQWANGSAHNQSYLDHFKTIFLRAANVKTFQSYNTDAAWDKIKSSLKRPDDKIIALPAPHKNTGAWTWRIAASIVIALGIGFYFYNSSPVDALAPVVVTAAKETVSDTLPDGSDVVLNKETKLTYSFDKKTSEHKVKLEGEAFFNINHNKNKKFVIDISGIYIRDIGTSFNVKAYPASNTIEVVVEKGEVMFYTDNDSGVYLKENGKGIYDKTTKRFTIDEPEANVLSYKTRVFNFSDADLQAIVQQLNSVYSQQIVLPENLDHCRLTVSFNNETQDEIMAVIAETLGLTVKHSNGKYVLEGSGCDP